MTSTYRELLIGCGRSRVKQYSALPMHPRGWQGLRPGTSEKGPVTLDIDPRVMPDLWCDLNAAPPWTAIPRSDPDERAHRLESDYWDEIHAYQVLEHLGSQGDASAFFAQFSELWRLLKPNGYLVASVPSRFSGWLWGDPSHRRAIVAETLVFLDQGQYLQQCDSPHVTFMSDFRQIYRADFKCIDQHDNRNDFVFVLQAVKPSRWVAPGSQEKPK
jgi:hypothetical protein